LDEEEKRKWYRLDPHGISNLIIVCSGIAFYLLLTHLPEVQAVVNDLLDVIAPFIAGFVIAYLLSTPVNFFERKVYRQLRCRRTLAVLTVYLIALLVFLILLQLILPQVIDSAMNLTGNISFYLRNLDTMVRGLIEQFDLDGEGPVDVMEIYNQFIKSTNDLANFASTALSAIPGILNFGVAVGNGVVTSLTALIVSVYILFGKDRLKQQLKKLIYALFPARGVHHILSVSGRANKVFVGFINGKLLDSAIMGLLCFLLTSLFRIPYAVLVSVVVGVTNVVPFFGPIIGAAPCLLILVLVDGWAALRFGVLILALQQFDGNILGPKILGDSTGLSAIWVLVAIVVGGGLFGFFGMLLGVPTFAVLYSLVREWANERPVKKGIDANGDPLEEKGNPAVSGK